MFRKKSNSFFGTCSGSKQKQAGLEAGRSAAAHAETLRRAQNILILAGADEARERGLP